MRNTFIFSVLIIFIINFEIKFLHGDSLKSLNLSSWKNQLSRTIRQATAAECIPPTINNGNINIIRKKSTKTRNSLFINITCDDNYILQPPIDDSIICINGVWEEEEIPECKSCVKRSGISAIYDTTDSQLLCPESISDIKIYRECGQRQDKSHQTFVFGGTNSKFAEFPWHVAIYKKDQNETVPIYRCGGSIINDKNILTVAYCFTDGYGKIISTREYYAAAGKYHREYNYDSETSQIRKIIKINWHSRYRGEYASQAYDIAVITVHEPFTISTLVHPVCIDWKTQFENEHFAPGKYGEVAGWGKTEADLYGPASKLQVLKVPYIEHKECSEAVPKSFLKFLTQDKFCAGYMNGSSVCNGDSGGGLVFERQENGKSKYYIRGLVSVGLQNEGRCDEYKYSMYTKVSEFIIFIRDTIENKNNSNLITFEPPSSSIPEIAANSTVLSVSCKTPNDEEAKCISIYDCKIFINALEKSPTKDVINYIKESSCGKESEKEVCCGSTFNYLSVIFSNPVIFKKPSKTENQNLLPTPGVCGKQTRARRGRIAGGVAADLYDYPWMALLEFGTPEKSAGFLCAGVLINERYVITTAHCAIRFRRRGDGQAFRVRLGEYDINSEIDCVNSKCADPPLNVDIEEAIFHPSFSYSKRINDIGLLRLAKNVSYTDFIQPICLPVSGETSAPGRRLYIGGWGYNKDIKFIPIKQKISLYAAPHEECIKKYNNVRIQIMSSQLCIVGDVGKDPCQGDTGTPVMATLSNSNYIYADGIISFGKSCGTGVPIVATRVASFMDWILDNIRP